MKRYNTALKGQNMAQHSTIVTFILIVQTIVSDRYYKKNSFMKKKKNGKEENQRGEGEHFKFESMHGFRILPLLVLFSSYF